MNSVFNKAVLVIDSCETAIQLRAASKYADLARASRVITESQRGGLALYIFTRLMEFKNKRPQNGASTAKILGLNDGGN